MDYMCRPLMPGEIVLPFVAVRTIRAEVEVVTMLGVEVPIKILLGWKSPFALATGMPAVVGVLVIPLKWRLARHE